MCVDSTPVQSLLISLATRNTEIMPSLSKYVQFIQLRWADTKAQRKSNRISNDDFGYFSKVSINGQLTTMIVLEICSRVQTPAKNWPAR